MTKKKPSKTPFPFIAKSRKNGNKILFLTNEKSPFRGGFRSFLVRICKTQKKNSEIQRDFLRKLEEISGVFPLFCL